MLSRVTIKLRLSAAFALLVAVTATLGFVAFRSDDTLATVTTRLYEHPFTVTNALADANADIIEIRSLMKDVVLATTPTDIAAAVSKTEVLDASLEKLFGTVRERFLGDKKMVDDAIQAYVAWKPIRAEVARLSLAGQRVEAEALLKGNGARQVQDLRGKMDAVRTWAAEKAVKFMESAEATRGDIQSQMTLLLVAVLSLSVLAAWVIIRSIARPISDLTRTMAEIGAGNTEVNIPRQSRGLYGIGRSKRLVGSLTRPEELGPLESGWVVADATPRM